MFVELLLTYGIIACTTNLHYLQIARNNILWIILNTNYLYHNDNVFKKINVLIIRKLFYETVAVFMIKNNLKKT
jgi:hypothetical protein